MSVLQRVTEFIKNHHNDFTGTLGELIATVRRGILYGVITYLVFQILR